MDHHHLTHVLQTSNSLKRPIENVDNRNENLNNDEFDVTWGGKRSRYLYTYKLQSPLPQEATDTSKSETDSVKSTQTKSTVEVFSQKDLSTDSCASNCNCKNSKKTQETEEFDVRSSSSCHNIHYNSSDSSTIITNEISQNIKIFNDTFPDIHNRHNEDTDYKLTTPYNNLPPPACFNNCLQCKKENPNPYYQFCFTCFRYRMEFFKKRPEPKNIKKLNIFLNKKVSNLIKGKNSMKSDFTDMSLKENILNKDNVKNSDNLCIICYFNKRNGIINHGKIGHIVTCYSCAKRLWSTSNKCPICNVKIKCVTKMIVI